MTKTLPQMHPIETAPRDGRTIWLHHEDVGTWAMQWAHIQRNGLFPGQVGMWVCPRGTMTWRDGEDGPSHWFEKED